jgi:hypothetical protein
MMMHDAHIAASADEKMLRFTQGSARANPVDVHCERAKLLYGSA